MRRGRLWISWEVHRRNRSLSTKIGAELVEITHAGGRLRRYMHSLARTISVLRSRKPSVVIAQNPSILLALAVTAYGKFSRFMVVIDAHNAGLYPAEGRTVFRQWIAEWIVRHADLTIVTNDALARFVASKGGTAAIVPDPLPIFPEAVPRQKLRGRRNVFFICTWADDEPYVKCIAAAAQWPEDVVLYVSGRSDGKEEEVGVISDNVELTGFISDEEYTTLLHSVDVAIDLTTRDNCLVCGAYEAVSASVPMVLSETAALVDYFQDAAIYCENTTNSIAKQVLLVLEDLETQKNAITRNRSRLEQQWTETLEHLQNMLPD